MTVCLFILWVFFYSRVSDFVGFVVWGFGDGFVLGGYGRVLDFGISLDMGNCFYWLS